MKRLMRKHMRRTSPPLPTPSQASSVRISQWRPSSSCESKAGKESGRGKERKEWLRRNAVSQPEEMADAKSGSKREQDHYRKLLKRCSNLNEMAWWFSAWVIYNKTWVRKTWWLQCAFRKAWFLWAFPLRMDQNTLRHPFSDDCHLL